MEGEVRGLGKGESRVRERVRCQGRKGKRESECVGDGDMRRERVKERWNGGERWEVGERVRRISGKPI